MSSEITIVLSTSYEPESITDEFVYELVKQKMLIKNLKYEVTKIEKGKDDVYIQG